MANAAKYPLVIVVYAGGIFMYFGESTPASIAFGLILALFAASAAGIFQLSMSLAMLLAFEKNYGDRGQKVLEYFVPEWRHFFEYLPKMDIVVSQPSYVAVAILVLLVASFLLLTCKALRSLF